MLEYNITRDCLLIMESDGSEYIGFITNPNMSTTQIENSKKKFGPDAPYLHNLVADGLTTIHYAPYTEEWDKMSTEDILDIKDPSNWEEFEPFLCICNLRRCLHGIIKEDLSNCVTGKCNKYNTDTKTRDFLFISMYIIEHLLDEDRILEAEGILEKIGYCIPICKNFIMESNDCNCK